MYRLDGQILTLAWCSKGKRFSKLEKWKWSTYFPWARILFITVIVYHVTKPGGNRVKPQKYTHLDSKRTENPLLLRDVLQLFPLVSLPLRPKIYVSLGEIYMTICAIAIYKLLQFHCLCNSMPSTQTGA